MQICTHKEQYSSSKKIVQHCSAAKNEKACIREDTDRKELCSWNEVTIHHLKLDMNTPDQDWINFEGVRLNVPPILKIHGESLN